MNWLLAMVLRTLVTWSELNAPDGTNGWDCYVESYPGRIDTHVCERDCYGTDCRIRFEFDGPDTTRLRSYAFDGRVVR